MDVDQVDDDILVSPDGKSIDILARNKVFVSREKKVFVSLSLGEKVFIKGQINVEVISGVIEVLGSFIKPSDGIKTLFSPKGYSLLYIGAHQESDISESEQNLNHFLKALTFENKEEVKEILIKKSKHVVFALTKVKQDPENMDLYLKHSSGGGLKLFARDDTKFKHLPEVLREAESVLNINLTFNQLETGSRYYQPGGDWELAISSAKITAQDGVHPRLLIAGGKGVGKSTFARFLANRLMSELGTPILFIDVDPGQAEFSVPGTMSCTKVKDPLLGPNFTHVHVEKEICFYLGSVDVGSCRNRYSSCIYQLKRFSESYKDIPWVINTMGFTKGLGLTLMIKTLEAFKPTTIVEIYSRSFKKNFNSVDFFPRTLSNLNLQSVVLRFEAIPQSIKVPDVSTKDRWGIPQPSLLRDIVLLSHLSNAFSFQPLQKVVPRAVTWSEVFLQIVDLETSFSTANLVRVLNMSFVSLGHVDTLLHSKSSTQKLNILEDKDMVVPALGFGIIRSIDAQRQIFYIITDLPIEVLKDVNCITYGSKIRLPDGIIARQSQEKNSLPYVTASETQSLLETPWQRSFKPKNDK